MIQPQTDAQKAEPKTKPGKNRLNRFNLLLLVIEAGLLLGLAGWLGGIKDLAAFKTFTENVRDLSFTAAQIVGALLLLSVVAIVFRWMASDEPFIEVAPFDNLTENKNYSGAALAESLTAEMLHIYQTLDRGFEETEADKDTHDKEKNEPKKRSPVRFVNPGESLEGKLVNIGVVGSGDTKLDIGALLVLLKRLWPTGDPGSRITGSLQKIGASLRLVVRWARGSEAFAWKIDREIQNDADVFELVRDMAFQMVHDQADESVPGKTWQGFKYYTDALDAYDEYTKTEQDEARERAEKNAREAIAVEPGFAAPFDLFYNLGYSYFNDDDYAKAEELFHIAVGLAPALEPDGTAPNTRLVDAFNGLGNACLNQGKYKSAIRAYERALREKEQAESYDGLGDAYVELDRYDDAVSAYDKSIALNPNNDLSHIGLGWIRLGKNDLALAEQEFKKAVALDEKYYVSIFLLGLAFALEGRADQALAQWQKALDWCQGELIYEKLDRAFYSVLLGDTERGIDDLCEILETENPSAEVLSDLLEDAEWVAKSPLKISDLDKVVEMLKQAIQKLEAESSLDEQDGESMVEEG